ncbi:hypothetical protein Prudu_89S000600 [Prunus dulcis]|uniref:Uncharacterized protein n=1 Tax=Prunus dulcis TaxID=3755 RepID=A0A5H2XGG2_PRUDU|nr:hypothetical protein Prudu_89S000600 [Prunus dulcis]
MGVWNMLNKKGTYDLYPSPWFPDSSCPYLFCANTPFLVHTQLEGPTRYLGVFAPFLFLCRFALQFPPKIVNYDCLNYPLSLPSRPFGQWASAPFRWENREVNPMSLNRGVTSHLTQRRDLYE